MYNNSEKEPLDGGSEPDIKGWDVFVDNPPPDEDDTLDSKWYQFSIKFLKVCAYFVTFAIVLGCSLVSKSLVLFMSSLIKPNRTGIPVCNQGIAGLDRDKRYETIFQLHDPERVAWIWSLLFILLVPEVMTLFRSVRICTFKSFRRPKVKEFLMVSDFYFTCSLRKGQFILLQPERLENCVIALR
jgi:chitin synthase